MTKLMEQALDVISRLPSETQDDIARALLGMAEAGEPDDIDAEHLNAVMDGMAQAERGEFATGSVGDIVKTAFLRHRR